MCPCLFGFRLFGVAGGSCASCVQSCCHGAVVPAGSAFARCTSAGMRGLGWSCGAGMQALGFCPFCFWITVTVLLAGSLALYLTGAYIAVANFFIAVANFFCGQYTSGDGCWSTANGTFDGNGTEVGIVPYLTVLTNQTSAVVENVYNQTRDMVGNVYNQTSEVVGNVYNQTREVVGNI